MENFLSLMNSIIDSWMSNSSMDIAMDMNIGFMCGVGLFFLLIPFLKEYPVSPASENEWDKPQVRRALVYTQWGSSLLFMAVAFTFSRNTGLVTIFVFKKKQ
jgi:hypothetical protein